MFSVVVAEASAEAHAEQDDDPNPEDEEENGHQAVLQWDIAHAVLVIVTPGHTRNILRSM